MLTLEIFFARPYSRVYLLIISMCEGSARKKHQTLQDMLPAKNLFFVDYCEQIRDHGSEEYVLSPVFDADSTVSSSLSAALASFFFLTLTGRIAYEFCVHTSS